MDNNQNQQGKGRIQRAGGNRKPRRDQREKPEFEQKILDLARVTRVTKGGKRMRFRTCLIIGDKKGRVGMGVAKGADVAISIDKAYRQAQKNMVTIPFVNGTIPHDVELKFGAAHIILKPAPEGTGLKSGGPVRVVLELAGVPNAVSKVLGSKSKINNVKAVFAALRSLKAPMKQEVREAKPKAEAQAEESKPAKN